VPQMHHLQFLLQFLRPLRTTVMQNGGVSH
jgi:hypothetical protein